MNQNKSVQQFKGEAFNSKELNNLLFDLETTLCSWKEPGDIFLRMPENEALETKAYILKHYADRINSVTIDGTVTFIGSYCSNEPVAMSKPCYKVFLLPLARIGLSDIPRVAMAASSTVVAIILLYRAYQNPSSPFVGFVFETIYGLCMFIIFIICDLRESHQR